MQAIRTITWRLIAVAFVALFFSAFWPKFLGGENSGSRLSEQAVIATYVAFAFGLVMPFRFLKIPATLTHEVGHALMSSLLGGKVNNIRVEIDESGVTWSKYKLNRFRVFFVSASGPLCNAAFFLLTMNLVVHNLSQYWIIFTLISVVLITITTVRSVWGWATATFIAFVLLSSLTKSLNLTSDVNTFANVGLWSNSAINLAVVFTAYTAAIEFRYAWMVRNPQSPNQDESRVSMALGVSPRIGGRLLVLVNLIFIALAFSHALGWENLWTPGSFL